MESGIVERVTAMAGYFTACGGIWRPMVAYWSMGGGVLGVLYFFFVLEDLSNRKKRFEILICFYF